MEVALKKLVYPKTSAHTHLHIEDFPFGELAGLERGVDMANNIPAEGWPLNCNDPSTSPTRLMGAEAMRRDHLVRY